VAEASPRIDPATTDVRVAAEDVRVRVAQGDKEILRGVTVRARAGEVLGVLGPSGAGKSTFFRALVGELPLETGRISLDGADVTRKPLWARARAGIGYVPQTPSVLWDLTVRENLRVFRRVVAGMRNPSPLAWLLPLPSRLAGEEDEAVLALARKVDLEARLDLRAGLLSGGERRRLELARALTLEPKVLVCDEPFAGVDPQQATRLGDLLAQLAAEEGVTVLLADHHVAEALRVCTRALLLLDGEVALEADPDSFREHPTVVGRYLGNWGRSIPPPSPR
jgi:lipopolysaccharide export system ATP-binding protein